MTKIDRFSTTATRYSAGDVVRVTDLSGAVDESEVWSYTWQ